MIQQLTRWLGRAIWAAYGVKVALTAPRPRPRRLGERLGQIPSRGLPLNKRVNLYWDPYQIPFIEAESDEDLAVALGAVHAHLRLTQLELLRRASQGRLAEMLGPVAIAIDHSIRILDYGRAIPAILAMLPEQTRHWLEHFVDGINHYIACVEELPPEFALLGIGREPWRIEDVLILGRLAATDVSWLVWFHLLAFRGRSDWPRPWQRLVEHGVSMAPGAIESGAAGRRLGDIVARTSRSGSNALALSPARTTTGAAILAADTHLSLTQPNPWLIAGCRSPTYHATGLFIPGLPAVAIGCNPSIAWSGTNLHAASSELVDVSTLGRKAFRERHERIIVRWAGISEIVIRDTAFGPIITDAPVLRWNGPEVLALQWMGHRPSDETTAMLRVNRATDWAEFRAALDGFAVPGLAMVYADRLGRIGKVLAAHLPARGSDLPRYPFAQPDELAPWNRILTSTMLPARLDPADGYIASANERPRDAPMLTGLFFSPDDRYRRLCELVEATSRFGIEEAMAAQRDVYHGPALDLLNQIKPALRAATPSWLDPMAVRRLIAALESWDGRYDAESSGALAYELLMDRLVRELVPAAHRRAYDAGWQGRGLMACDLLVSPGAALSGALRRVLPAAARDLARFRCWGSLHRLRLTHPLAATPGIGRRFVHGDSPASGSSETLMKTAHSLTSRRHAAVYGSTARFIRDFSKPGEAYIALLGGQDGWAGSTTSFDQVKLWRRGGYVSVPLTLEAARGRAAHHTALDPGRSGPTPS